MQAFLSTAYIYSVPVAVTLQIVTQQCGLYESNFATSGHYTRNFRNIFYFFQNLNSFQKSMLNFAYEKARVGSPVVCKKTKWLKSQLRWSQRINSLYIV